MHSKLSAVAFVLLLITPAIVFSQSNFSIGPRVGLNISNVSGIDNSESITGLVAGLTSTYSINQFSGVSVDVLYSEQGYATANGQETRLEYLQVPVNYTVFYNNLGERFRPKLYVGLTPAFLLNGETGNNEISNSLEDVILHLSAGTGFHYRLDNRVWLNADIRALFGLTDIRAEGSRGGDTRSPRDIQLSLGVAFGL